MFDPIDIWFVNVHQWVVRQIGLYTPFERKDVLELNLRLMRLLFGTFILFSFLAIIFAVDRAISYTYSILIACNYFHWFPEYKKLLELSKKNPEADVLPDEIVTRKLERYGLLLLLLVFFVLFVTMYCLISPVLSFPYEALFKSNVILVILAFTFTLQEYLLCTTSLPPGEKQRKKEEREMKYLTPQRIKN